MCIAFTQAEFLTIKHRAFFAKSLHICWLKAVLNKAVGIRSQGLGAIHEETPVRKLATTFLLLASICFKTAAADTLELHIDADYSINAVAAQSIELGVRAALSEVNGMVADHRIVVVANDHRGNVKRSRRTMEQFLRNDRALAVIGGLHSPPYLTNRDFMNENGILTLLPWSAAAGLTRTDEGSKNWLFRLSVNDAKTPAFFVNKVMEAGCRAVGLVLLDTGWGRGAHKGLSNALAARGRTSVFSQFFDSAISQSGARTLAEDIARSGADCAIMLSNWDNGAEVALALHERIESLRIFSHWGIMGGAFAELVPHEVRSDLDLQILQTCGLREEAAENEVLKVALRSADQGYRSLADVPAPTGFVHGYDLTRVLIAAVQQAAVAPGWGGDITSKRLAVLQALEALDLPVEGILKTYAPPFRPGTVDDPSAHEALGIADLCMARFGASNNLMHSP